MVGNEGLQKQSRRRRSKLSDDPSVDFITIKITLQAQYWLYWLYLAVLLPPVPKSPRPQDPKFPKVQNPGRRLGVLACLGTRI